MMPLHGESVAACVCAACFDSGPVRKREARCRAGFEESHRVFRDAMPNGFAWEVTDVYSGCELASA